jgi:hypothetical protein
MIEIKHLSTTKLQNYTSRLTFEIETKGYTDFKCELLIDLRWLFGSIQEISVGDFYIKSGGNYHIIHDFKETFHIDITDIIAKKSSRFNWQLIGLIAFNGSYSRLKGKGKIFIPK